LGNGSVARKADVHPFNYEPKTSSSPTKAEKVGALGKLTGIRHSSNRILHQLPDARAWGVVFAGRGTRHGFTSGLVWLHSTCLGAGN